MGALEAAEVVLAALERDKQVMERELHWFRIRKDERTEAWADHLKKIDVLIGAYQRKILYYQTAKRYENE